MHQYTQLLGLIFFSKGKKMTFSVPKVMASMPCVLKSWKCWDKSHTWGKRYQLGEYCFDDSHVKWSFRASNSRKFPFFPIFSPKLISYLKLMGRSWLVFPKKGCDFDLIGMCSGSFWFMLVCDNSKILLFLKIKILHKVSNRLCCILFAFDVRRAQPYLNAREAWTRAFTRKKLVVW